MRQLLLSCLALALSLNAGCSPQAAAGPAFSAADSLAIDSLYATFRLGYRELDAPRVAALYAADALYGAPGAPGFSLGRGPIANNFAGFFDYIRKDSAHLELRFRFVRRFRAGAFASDAGYYWLRPVWRDSAGPADVGKFVTIVRRDSTGQWRFSLDSYSGATVAAFDAAPDFEP